MKKSAWHLLVMGSLLGILFSAPCSALAIADSLVVKSDTSRSIAPVNAAPLKDKKLTVVKRPHSYFMQVYAAAGMMAFIALILTSSQEWNP